MFLQGEGINSSYAIYQEASGQAEAKKLALRVGSGSSYLLQTSFEYEVWAVGKKLRVLIRKH